MSGQPCARGFQPPASPLEMRLERGEVVFFPVSPFSLPEGDDRLFLLEQRLASRAHKNISFDPRRKTAAGFHNQSPEQAERLRSLLASFSETATNWLAQTLPRYAQCWELDRVSYRPEEEATRRLRYKARNDLLHVDAFPSRPTQGWRILRLFANVNPVDPRIWVTSEPFAKLLERYGEAAGLPGRRGPGWVEQVQQRMIGLFRPGRRRRSAYDSFMLRFHDYLKANDHFQERGKKQFWSFPPNSVWLTFTDTASHAVLRGRYALEHSYFVSPAALGLPDESPAALLTKACGMSVLERAA
ncbi:MAG TPA: Kdo hydroxylase family protein [Gemmataceae bacterium]